MSEAASRLLLRDGRFARSTATRDRARDSGGVSVTRLRERRVSRRATHDLARSRSISLDLARFDRSHLGQQRLDRRVALVPGDDHLAHRALDALRLLDRAERVVVRLAAARRDREVLGVVVAVAAAAAAAAVEAVVRRVVVVVVLAPHQLDLVGLRTLRYVTLHYIA